MGGVGEGEGGTMSSSSNYGDDEDGDTQGLRERRVEHASAPAIDHLDMAQQQPYLLPPCSPWGHGL